MAEPWFVSAFSRGYLELYAHRDDAEARAQAAALVERGLVAKGAAVLDLACGAGRHLKALRALGVNAWGLDLSRDLLAAGGLAGLAGLAVRGDMRALPFAAARFDGVLSLFTSFGYFDTDNEQLEVLREIRRVLRPGGSLILDHINPGPTLSQLQPQTREVRGKTTVIAQRSFDPRRKRLIKDVEFSRAGKTERWRESVRVFEPDELDALCAAAGLFVVSRSADFAGAPFELQRSPRQLVRAVKT